MKKPFKDTKLGGWLKNKFPDVLDVAANLTGIEALSAVGDLIEGKSMSEEEKLEFLKLKTEYELEVLRLEIDNTKNAREREARIIEATGKHDWAQWVVGLIGLVISSSVIAVGLFGEIKDRELYFHLLGITEGAILLAIFGYYFGSSNGSKQKQSLISKLQDRL